MSTTERKQSINCTLEPNLARRAKAFKINLSRVLAKAVELEVKELEAKKWREENAQAIRDANEFMAKVGHFSDAHRKF